MLTLTRTANAGVLLAMDGKKILLDGVCREIYPYSATPDHVKKDLSLQYPDIVAVSHRHDDHCDPFFEHQYQMATGRSVLDPACGKTTISCGDIQVHVIPSRHIGKADIDHVSFVLEGSICVWFMGDAAPAQWKHIEGMKEPDLLIAPYAYASTQSAWNMTKAFGAKKIVLLHLPEKDRDPYGLWGSVVQTVGENGPVFIPKMEEFIEIAF